MRDQDLDTVKSAFRRLGVTTLLAKRLAENDNSKNQIYLGGSFEVLNLIPFSDSRVVRSSKGRAVIHATVSLSWLREDGTIGRRLERTGLTLVLTGADRETGMIEQADGSISLVDDEGRVAAGWPFASLIEHWNRKHAEAAYVPSMKLVDPLRFRYADTIFLGYGTDFGRFMRGLAEGVVCYDPGIKLEGVGGGAPKAHKRSQFRVGFAVLGMLYGRFETVALS
ncbi:MAG: MvaI/BcnI family restriction endonuclease [Gemmatimonadaceae bacterium]|nr:MvaI/BcnI family restriction endonuclease [Gemmatimonadaceae bacterium]